MDRVELVDVCSEHTATSVQWSCHPSEKPPFPRRALLNHPDAPSHFLDILHAPRGPQRADCTARSPPRVDRTFLFCSACFAGHCLGRSGSAHLTGRALGIVGPLIDISLIKTRTEPPGWMRTTLGLNAHEDPNEGSSIQEFTGFMQWHPPPLVQFRQLGSEIGQGR